MESSPNGQRSSTFSVIPALAASSVGILYAAGTLQKSTQLHGAHLRVLDFLPLVPLPDLLSQGVGVLVGALLAVAQWLLLFALLIWTTRHKEEAASVLHVPRLSVTKREPQATATPSRKRRVTRRLYKLTVGVPAIFVWTYFLNWLNYDPIAASSVFLGGTAASIVPWIAKDRRLAALGLFAIILASVALNLVHSYVAPSPLPRVILQMQSGSRQTGFLVVHSEGHWYLTEHRTTVTAVPDDRVVSARIISRNKRSLRTGWRMVRGLF